MRSGCFLPMGTSAIYLQKLKSSWKKSNLTRSGFEGICPLHTLLNKGCDKWSLENKGLWAINKSRHNLGSVPQAWCTWFKCWFPLSFPQQFSLFKNVNQAFLRRSKKIFQTRQLCKKGKGKQSNQSTKKKWVKREKAQGYQLASTALPPLSTEIFSPH